jgi:hypothetical protein
LATGPRDRLPTAELHTLAILHDKAGLVATYRCLAAAFDGVYVPLLKKSRGWTSACNGESLNVHLT